MHKPHAAWSVPSVEVFEISVPGDGKQLTPTGGIKLLESYLRRFGCVPVMRGTPPRRMLARANQGRWELHELDGSTELEQPPTPIVSAETQRQFLVAHSWYHVGYTVHRTIVEFAFHDDGEGFSRHATWGFGTTVPDVVDCYWRYAITDNVFRIEWEDGDVVSIPFTLERTLRAATSLADGSLSFYDAVLKVDKPLFPPSSEFAKTLLSEYWGQTNNHAEVTK